MCGKNARKVTNDGNNGLDINAWPDMTASRDGQTFSPETAELLRKLRDNMSPQRFLSASWAYDGSIEGDNLTHSLLNSWQHRVRNGFNPGSDHDYLPWNMEGMSRLCPDLTQLKCSKRFNELTADSLSVPFVPNGYEQLRRDPLLYFYLPIACPHYEKCSNMHCIFAHSSSELSKHPLKYKTELCPREQAPAPRVKIENGYKHEYFFKSRVCCVEACPYRHVDRGDEAGANEWSMIWENHWCGWRQFLKVFHWYAGMLTRFSQRPKGGIGHLRKILKSCTELEQQIEHICLREFRADYTPSSRDLLQQYYARNPMVLTYDPLRTYTRFEARISEQPFNMLLENPIMQSYLGGIMIHISESQIPDVQYWTSLMLNRLSQIYQIYRDILSHLSIDNLFISSPTDLHTAGSKELPLIRPEREEAGGGSLKIESDDEGVQQTFDITHALSNIQQDIVLQQQPISSIRITKIIQS